MPDQSKKLNRSKNYETPEKLVRPEKSDRPEKPRLPGKIILSAHKSFLILGKSKIPQKPRALSSSLTHLTFKLSKASDRSKWGAPTYFPFFYFVSEFILLNALRVASFKT